ncbi:transmembrane domain-containing protein [Cryptosporidium canis]|uniref:Transmembrane domain-containing protein n=1 Tax=Cryptosporidium canis TaxID=195482 RepID=A0ABQ8PBE8_9CRYT|nr:transmembrane domain-containing protein [Cryptosporidium canis]KAJ1615292.1 transmembrane domain-containing protein [Cryptosporidium canis]
MQKYEEKSPLIREKKNSKSVFSFLNSILFKPGLSFSERKVHLTGGTSPSKFVPNIVCNQKYSLITFIPKVLYDQFSNFFNFFYLVVALFQLVPELRTGPLFTYIAPLLLVLSITIGKEAIDDIKRYKRDKEFNNKKYRKITNRGIEEIRSSDIKVGDLIEINTNDRVPADILFIRTNDPTGTVFIRTDQLDGETDWKVKRALGITQHLETLDDLFNLDIIANIECPKKDIYVFNGTIQYYDQHVTHSFSSDDNVTALNLHGSTTNSNSPNIEKRTAELKSITTIQPVVEPLTLDNTIWANSVLTCGKVYGLVIYTGIESRSLMNTCTKSLRTKTGLLDTQVNTLSKILFVLLFITSFVLVFCKGFDALWYVSFARFMLLLSSIIPISLRVNLEMAKIVFSSQINNDKQMKNVLVRSSIPEELGRVDYLLTDKTGTLTQNYMIVQTLHLGNAVFHPENFCEIVDALQFIHQGQLNIERENILHIDTANITQTAPIISNNPTLWNNSTSILHLQNFMLCIALCHNIFPRSSIDATNAHGDRANSTEDILGNENPGSDECMVDLNQKHIVYQSSSPDEIALINFAASLGLRLVNRSNENMDIDLEKMHTAEPSKGLLNNTSDLRNTKDYNAPVKLSFRILACFPFCSSTKRMGILLEYRGKYVYFCKGAETVMIELLRQRGSGWLMEECTNLARLGLRTLVFSYRVISKEEYEAFNNIYSYPCTSLLQRDKNLSYSRKILEKDMELLGLTGVEDKLQVDVPLTLEALRYAGIKIWLLTGDKLETALCIAISAGLKPKHLNFFILESKSSKPNINNSDRLLEVDEIKDQLLRYVNEYSSSNVLVVEGFTLSICIKYCPFLLIHAATLSPAVVWCRCSPSQKKELVLLLKEYHLKHFKLFEEGSLISLDSESLDDKDSAIGRNKSEMIEKKSNSIGSIKRRTKEMMREYNKGNLNMFSFSELNPKSLRIDGFSPISEDGNIDKWANESGSANRYNTQNTHSFTQIEPRMMHNLSNVTGNTRTCRICAVGDGGNDVGMIQAADIGIGIVGKEGQQAANAADISIYEFADLRPLFLFHGRHAYQNSAKLAYFVIHRGLIIAFMQCVFSALFYFIPVALFQGWLAVGYATYYTMAPVFSLVFDVDVNRSTALLYPELYRHLKAGRVVSTKTFFCWVWKSLYQGTVIMLGAFLLFKDNILMNLVAIAFTSLILSEILNVFTEIHHWNEVIISSCVISILIYFASFFLLDSHFDLQFISTFTFWGNICVLTSISWGPILLYKLIKKTIHPPRYYKLMQH